MKKFIIIIISLTLIGNTYVFSQNVPGCCSFEILFENTLPNLEVTVLDLNNNVVNNIQPSTNYILRLKPAAGTTCFIEGSGCDQGQTPANLSILLLIGAVINGSTGVDVGPSNDFTASFNITTEPPPTFSPGLVIVTGAQCAAPGSCVLESAQRGLNWPQ